MSAETNRIIVNTCLGYRDGLESGHKAAAHAKFVAMPSDGQRLLCHETEMNMYLRSSIMVVYQYVICAKFEVVPVASGSVLHRDFGFGVAEKKLLNS